MGLLSRPVVSYYPVVTFFVLDTLWNTMHEQTLNCCRCSPCEMLVNTSGNHSSGGEAQNQSSPIALMCRTRVCHLLQKFKTCALEAGTCAADGSRLLRVQVPSGHSRQHTSVWYIRDDGRRRGVPVSMARVAETPH